MHLPAPPNQHLSSLTDWESLVPIPILPVFLLNISKHTSHIHSERRQHSGGGLPKICRLLACPSQTPHRRQAGKTAYPQGLVQGVPRHESPRPTPPLLSLLPRFTQAALCPEFQFYLPTLAHGAEAPHRRPEGSDKCLKDLALRLFKS